MAPTHDLSVEDVVEDLEEEATFVGGAAAVSLEGPGSARPGPDDGVEVTQADGVEVTKAVLNLDAKAIDIDSGSESSSSSSSGRSRSVRGRAGAAAAAALVTAAAPVDIDEEEKVVERVLELPNEFAMQLQSEGGVIEVMASTGTVINIAPGANSGAKSSLRVAGTAGAVGRAVWELERLLAAEEQRKKTAAEEEARREASGWIEELEIPGKSYGAVVGPGQSAIQEIREQCDGVMIALMPPRESDGVLVACVGPGAKTAVQRALEALRKRLVSASDPRK